MPSNENLIDIEIKMKELVAQIEHSITKYPTQIPSLLIKNELNSLLIYNEKLLNYLQLLNSESFEININYFDQKVTDTILSIQDKVNSFLKKQTISQFETIVEELIKNFAQHDFAGVPLYLKDQEIEHLKLVRKDFDKIVSQEKSKIKQAKTDNEKDKIYQSAKDRLIFWHDNYNIKVSEGQKRFDEFKEKVDEFNLLYTELFGLLEKNKSKSNKINQLKDKFENNFINNFKNKSLDKNMIDNLLLQLNGEVINVRYQLKKISDNLDKEIEKYTDIISIDNIKFRQIISAACTIEIKTDNDSSLVKLDKEILNKRRELALYEEAAKLSLENNAIDNLIDIINKKSTVSSSETDSTPVINVTKALFHIIYLNNHSNHFFDVIFENLPCFSKNAITAFLQFLNEIQEDLSEEDVLLVKTKTQFCELLSRYSSPKALRMDFIRYNQAREQEITIFTRAQRKILDNEDYVAISQYLFNNDLTNTLNYKCLTDESFYDALIHLKNSDIELTVETIEKLAESKELRAVICQQNNYYESKLEAEPLKNLFNHLLVTPLTAIKALHIIQTKDVTLCKLWLLVSAQENEALEEMLNENPPNSNNLKNIYSILSLVADDDTKIINNSYLESDSQEVKETMLNNLSNNNHQLILNALPEASRNPDFDQITKIIETITRFAKPYMDEVELKELNIKPSDCAGVKNSMKTFQEKAIILMLSDKTMAEKETEISALAHSEFKHRHSFRRNFFDKADIFSVIGFFREKHGLTRRFIDAQTTREAKLAKELKGLFVSNNREAQRRDLFGQQEDIEDGYQSVLN